MESGSCNALMAGNFQSYDYPSSTLLLRVSPIGMQKYSVKISSKQHLSTCKYILLSDSYFSVQVFFSYGDVW